MTSFRITQQIFKFMIVGGFLFGCNQSSVTPSPHQIDKSPFTGIPCAAPCWQGLIVGKSSESDVASTIPTLSFIDQNSVYYHRMPSMSTLDPDMFGEGVEITANCINSGQQCLTIKVVENILTEVLVMLNYTIEVEQTIKYLGNPDYVGFDRAGGELIACRVYMIWREKLLVLASQVFEGSNASEKNCFMIRDTGKVSSKLLILEAQYVSVATIEKLLTSSASEFFEFAGTTP